MNQDKNLVSLQEHNDRMKSIYLQNFANSNKTGIECPLCKAEMIYTDPNMVLASMPPKKRVMCEKCKHLAFVIV